MDACKATNTACTRHGRYFCTTSAGHCSPVIPATDMYNKTRCKHLQTFGVARWRRRKMYARALTLEHIPTHFLHKFSMSRAVCLMGKAWVTTDSLTNSFQVGGTKDTDMSRTPRFAWWLGPSGRSQRALSIPAHESNHTYVSPGLGYHYQPPRMWCQESC